MVCKISTRFRLALAYLLAPCWWPIFNCLQYVVLEQLVRAGLRCPCPPRLLVAFQLPTAYQLSRLRLRVHDTHPFQKPILAWKMWVQSCVQSSVCLQVPVWQNSSSVAYNRVKVKVNSGQLNVSRAIEQKTPLLFHHGNEIWWYAFSKKAQKARSCLGIVQWANAWDMRLSAKSYLASGFESALCH